MSPKLHRMLGMLGMLGIVVTEPPRAIEKRKFTAEDQRKIDAAKAKRERRAERRIRDAKQG